MNRDQTDLQVHAWDAVGGNDRVLVKEHDPYWINSLDPPRFLADGKRFLWLSERDGWLHLYLYDRQGHLLKQLTHGPWMIDHPFFVDAPTFQVDEKSGWIYFVSTRKDPRQRQLERVRVDGQGLEQISKRAGEHSLDLSPDGEFLVDVYSNPVTPPAFHLRRASGEPLRTLGKPVNHLDEYEMAATEFVEVKAKDGSTLYARMAKPLNFDPAKKYPVVVYVYGGPHAQMVRDGWGVYRQFTGAVHQSCLAHLLRRCREMIAVSRGAMAHFPLAVHKVLQMALKLRARRDQGQIGSHGLAAACGRLEVRMDRLLSAPRQAAQNQRLARHLRRERDALFPFLYCPGLEATNWRAEQAIRPMVVTRKVWGGNRTPAGARTQSILLSVLQTCRQQHHSAIPLLGRLLCSQQPRILNLNQDHSR